MDSEKVICYKFSDNNNNNNNNNNVLGRCLAMLFILFVNDIVCMADNVSVKLFSKDAKIYTVIDNVNFNSSLLP